MTLKEQYKDRGPIGVFPESNWGGLEILDLEYGIDDRILACYNFGGGRFQLRWHRIYFTNTGRSYIRKSGRRYYLDDIMRV